jgi:hypothetical protein
MMHHYKVSQQKEAIMKSIKYAITLVMFLISTQIMLAQETLPAPPVPPEPEEPASYWKLSEQEEQSYLKDLDAELKLKLKEIKKHDADKYAEFLRELHWRQMETHYMTRGKERERLELERKITESEIRTEALAIKYRANPSEEIRKELAKNVGELFDQKEKQRKWEVETLENEIAQLKEKIVSRQKNRDIIIRRRVEELLGVEEDLEWD